MIFWFALLFCSMILHIAACEDADDTTNGVYPLNNNRHVQKLRSYNREMYKIERCDVYHPVRINCTSVLHRDLPTEEGQRYKVCFAKCTLAAVCEDRECGPCAESRFEYRQFSLHDGFKRWCRPVPCAKKGFVKWTDYACQRERSCTLLHCKLGVRKVKAKQLQPFTLQLLASRTEEDIPEPDTQELGTVELGYEVQLGSATLGEPVHFQTNVTIPTIPEDLYLLADATGSLQEAISVIQRDFFEVMQGRLKVCPSAAFGVGFFRDESSKPEKREVLRNGFSNLQSITQNTTRVQHAVDKLLASAGGDTPEAGLLALYRIATDSAIGWREGSRKIVVVFGDAPQHEPVCIGEMKLTRSDVIKALRARGISVVAIQVGEPGLDAETTPYRCPGLGARQRGGQMSAITQLTDGFIARRIFQDGVVDAVKETIAHLNIKFEIDASDCGPEYKLEFAAPFPDYVNYGDVLEVKKKFTAMGAACESKRPKKCILKYIVGGVTISLQDIAIDDIQGC